MEGRTNLTLNGYPALHPSKSLWKVFAAIVAILTAPIGAALGRGRAPHSQLYLISATAAAGNDVKFPATLYNVSPAGNLRPVRDLASQGSGVFLTCSATGLVVIVSPAVEASAATIVHFDSPNLVDRVVFAERGVYIAPWRAALSEPNGMLAILLPFVNGGSSAPASESLAAISASPARGSRVRFGVWGDYAALRFDGLPGGPDLDGETDIDAVAVDDSLGIPHEAGPPVIIDALPPILRGQARPKVVQIVAASKEYVITSVLPRFVKTRLPGAEDGSSKHIFVHDRSSNSWHTDQIEGNASASRLFGSWLASVVMYSNFDHKLQQPLSSKSGERTWATDRVPSVYDLYAHGLENDFVLPGILTLQNLADGRELRIETGQEDSEILWVGQDKLLYRVNDTIYQASIAGDKLEDASVIAKGDDVPEVHWAFWSS
jgi:hypothetical protein